MKMLCHNSQVHVIYVVYFWEPNIKFRWNFFQIIIISQLIENQPKLPYKLHTLVLGTFFMDLKMLKWKHLYLDSKLHATIYLGNK